MTASTSSDEIKKRWFAKCYFTHN